MALFKAHVTFGALVAAAGTIALYYYALVTNPILLGLLFAVTAVASFLPDLDSDSGLPYQIIFGISTFIFTALVLYYTYQNEPKDWRILIGLPSAAVVFVWMILGGIFKHITAHRGMFHSIPAAAIAGLLAYFIADKSGRAETVSLFFGAAAAAGYLSHLILDELHSGFNLDGSHFHPKQSLGTALKFVSSNKGANVFTYLLLVALIYTVLS